MGFFDPIRNLFTRQERFSLKNPADWAVFIKDQTSKTGQSVDVESSLKSSAYYAPLVITMNTVAGLPKSVRRVTERGSQNDKNHDQYTLFAQRPNKFQTAEKFWSEFVFNIRRGNGLAWLEGRDRPGGRPTAYWNLNPDKAYPDVIDGDLFIKYEGKTPHGIEIGTRPYREFLHVPNDIGLTKDDLGFIWGRSSYSFAREAIGLNLQTEASLALYLKESGLIHKILTTDKTLTKEQRHVLRQSLKKMQAGHSMEGQIHLLDSGLKIEGVHIPLADISPSEVRNFGIEEAARFQTFPALFKIGHHHRANFANAYQASVEFKEMIGTFLKPIEAELNYKLLTPSQFEQESHFFHFETKGLLQADPVQRAQFYTAMKNIGAMTPNMALDIEDMDTMGKEGDIATTQVQNIPLDLLREYWQSMIQKSSEMTPREAAETILKATNGIHESTN